MGALVCLAFSLVSCRRRYYCCLGAEATDKVAGVSLWGVGDRVECEPSCILMNVTSDETGW